MPTQKITLQKLSKIAIGLIIININVTSCSHPKTNNWDDLSKSVHEQADSLFVNNYGAKNKWCNCVLEKLKSNQLNIPQDSLQREFYIIGRDCASKIKDLRLKGWSMEFEVVLKKNLLQSRIVEGLQEKHKIPFCNCYIEKLKKLYPNGLNGVIPDNVQDSISVFCAHQIGIN